MLYSMTQDKEILIELIAKYGLSEGSKMYAKMLHQ